MNNSLYLSLAALVLSFLGLSWFAGSDAPYVPTKKDKIKKPLELAGVTKGKIFYELGSGDGRVVLTAAQMGATSFGVEQSWIRVWMSRYAAKKLHLQSATFFHGNIFSRRYYPANIVFIYMLQPCVNRLEKKLQTELAKGSIIITQTYHFKHLKPFRRFDNFYLYRL